MKIKSTGLLSDKERDAMLGVTKKPMNADEPMKKKKGGHCNKFDGGGMVPAQLAQRNGYAKGGSPKRKTPMLGADPSTWSPFPMEGSPPPPPQQNQQPPQPQQPTPPQKFRKGGWC